MVPDIEQLIGGGGATPQCILGGLSIEGLWRAHNEGPVALGLISVGVSHLFACVSTPLLHPQTAFPQACLLLAVHASQAARAML